MVVGWGKIGTTGQTLTKPFYTEQNAIKFYRKIIGQKLDKGYREQEPRAAGAEPPPQDAKRSEPKAKPKEPSQPSGRAPGKKSSYKIYGKKGKSSVHTRYGGRVYVPTQPSRFRPGDNASVGLGNDGRLSVNDPTTGRSQVWDSTHESVSRLDELIVEHIARIIASD